MQDDPNPPVTHGIFYIGVTRPSDNISGWSYTDGTPVFQDRAWYSDNPNVPLPSEDQINRNYIYFAVCSFI